MGLALGNLTYGQEHEEIIVEPDVGSPYLLTFAQNYGQMINIHPAFPGVRPAVNSEFNLGKVADGSRVWHRPYGMAETGLSASFGWLGNADTLGNVIAVFPYIRFNRRFGASRLSLVSTVGGGLAWFTKPYDAIGNPGNLVIGSDITAIFHLKTGLRYALGYRWALALTGSIRHYSNGHLRVPNIGANMVYGALELSFRPGALLSTNAWWPEPYGQKPKVDKRVRVGLALDIGLHEVEGTTEPTDGPLYPVYSATVYGAKRLGYKSQVMIGLNYNYYTAFYDFMASQEFEYSNRNAYAQKINLFLGHEFFLARFSFQSSFGANLYYPLRGAMEDAGLIKKKFMHRWITGNFALNYYLRNIDESLKRAPYIGLGLRSIGGKADFLEARVGFVW